MIPAENLNNSETNNSKSSMPKIYTEIRLEFLHKLFASYSKSDQFQIAGRNRMDDLLRLHSKLLKLFSFRIQI